MLRIEDLPAKLKWRILSHAEGNPFYVEEVIRSLVDTRAIVEDEASGRWQATREVADIAAEYDLRVSYEPLAWRTVWSVNQGLEVIEEADRPNVGLLVDAFHAFAGGDDLEAIRKLDPEIITTFHMGDAGPRQGDQWSDDDRTVMPGEGIVPAREIAQAVLDTGYDGLISDEVFPTLFSDWSAERIAKTLKAGVDAILASLPAA